VSPSAPGSARPAPVVALIGPIGAGKSVVRDFLAEQGAAVIDFDDYSRRLLQPGSPQTESVRQAFGEPYVSAEGVVDRAALAALIFGDDGARRRLEAILHPPMLALLREALAEFRRRPSAPVLAVEGAILGQLGPELFDAVLLVNAPVSERARRLQACKGMPSETAQRAVKLHEQLGIGQEPADFTLDTGGTLEDVREQVARLWTELTAPASEM
jgi:dephospho-CoA kinase